MIESGEDQIDLLLNLFLSKCLAGIIKRRIKAVLFDLFDTLFLLESETIHIPASLGKLVEFLNSEGIAVSLEDFQREFTKAVNDTKSEISQTLEEPHFNFYVSKALGILGHDSIPSSQLVKRATKAFGDEFKKHAHLDPEAVGVLEKLHGRYELGIVSNLAISECAWELVQESKLKGFFDVIIVSGDINKRKPSSKIFWEASRILNVEVSETVFVGDNLDSDILGARKAGMLAVHIRKKPIKYFDIVPNAYISSLRELPAILERLDA